MSEYDPTDLTSEDLRTAAADAAVEQELRWEVEDLTWLMGIKRGRRIVWRLLSHAGVFRQSFDPSNATVTAFQEGQRSMGLRLLAQLMAHCPTGYAQMVEERGSNV